MKIKVPVSVGELVDKVTILEIKSKKIKDKKSLFEINKELTLLNTILINNNILTSQVKKELKKLKSINLKLWSIEDKKRNHEMKSTFDQKFIWLARQVYLLNDKRALLKKNINNITGSNINEIKSYKKY